MKYKYPDIITVGGTSFKIIYDKEDDSGAHFSFSGDVKHHYPHIFFGLNSNLSYLEMVIHELKEIIQIEQDARSRRRNDGAYIFNYTHAEHTDLCARLAGLLKEFIE